MINRIQTLSVALITALFCVGGIAGTSEAASFIAQTKGHNNRNDPDFFSLALDSDSNESDVLIKSIQIDLAAGGDRNAFFDYSAYSPTLNLSSLQGLIESDITFTPLKDVEVFDSTFNPDEGDTSVLQISFAEGSFGVGDSFKFGAETDNLDIGSRDDGDDFARSGVSITLELEDGTVETVTFSEVENNHSIAISSIIHAAQAPEPVAEIPEPLSLFGLFTVGVLGTVTLKR